MSNALYLREYGEEQHHGRVVKSLYREPEGEALRATAFHHEEVEDEIFACRRRGVQKQRGRGRRHISRI